MSVYTIDTRNYTSILRANLRKGIRQCPRLDERLLFNVKDIPHALLNETIVRLFWNDFNFQARFPHDKWDDTDAIKKWFDCYDVGLIETLADGETRVADWHSERLFELVIDPTVCFIHENIYDRHLKDNWEWDEHQIKEVRSDFLVMETLGDFRVRDWERLKRTYEGNHSRDGFDIYHLYAPNR